MSQKQKMSQLHSHITFLKTKVILTLVFLFLLVNIGAYFWSSWKANTDPALSIIQGAFPEQKLSSKEYVALYVDDVAKVERPAYQKKVQTEDIIYYFQNAEKTEVFSALYRPSTKAVVAIDNNKGTQ
jgi:hypothetical protein